MTDSPHGGGLSTTGPPALEHAPGPHPTAQKGSRTRSFSAWNSMRRAASTSRTLRPLRGRPCGPILDPDAYPGAFTTRRRTASRKITYSNTRLTGPAPSGMTCAFVARQRMDVGAGVLLPHSNSSLDCAVYAFSSALQEHDDYVSAALTVGVA